MKIIRKIALFPLGLIYGSILQIRNWCFDHNVLKSTKPSFPSIAVGNLSLGGTGKTPAIKYLLENMGKSSYLVISRGYGRKSKGYHVVQEDMNSDISGDEPLEIKRSFPDSKVVVCEKRSLALENISNEEDFDLVLFDDLFQHRYVQTDCNILLSSYDLPFYKDFVLPAGTLREFSLNKKRADLLVITKCPNNLSIESAEVIRKKTKMNVPVFFAGLDYKSCHWVINQPKRNNVILLASIANADNFFSEGQRQFSVVEKIRLPDHYNYTEKKVKEIIGLANKLKADLVTTKKDMAKISKFELHFNDLSVGVIEVKMQILFDETKDFIKLIKEKTNHD